MARGEEESGAHVVTIRPTFKVGDRVRWGEAGHDVFGHVVEVRGYTLVLRGPDGWKRRVPARFVRNVEGEVG